MGTAASSQSAPVLFLAAASQAPHVSEGDRDHNRGIAICNCGQAERVCDILDLSLLLTRGDHVSPLCRQWDGVAMQITCSNPD